MACRSRNYVVFPHKVALVIGICLLLIGLGCTVVGVLGKTVNSWGSEIGAGIWCGVAFFLAGISGIVASLLKKVPFIKVFMSFCLLALILSFVLVVLSGGGLNYRSRFYHMKNDSLRIKESTKYVHGILLLLGIGSFILSVIGTIIGVKYAFLVGIRQRKCKKHKRLSRNRKNRYITDTVHQELTEEFLSPEIEDVCQNIILPAPQRSLDINSHNSVPAENQREPRAARRNKRRKKKHKRSTSNPRGNPQTPIENIEHVQSSTPVQNSDRSNRNIPRVALEHPVVYNIVQYFEHPSVQDDEELPPYEEFAGHSDTDVLNPQSVNTDGARNINTCNSNLNTRNLRNKDDRTIVCDNFKERQKRLIREQGLLGAECSVENQVDNGTFSSPVMFDEQDNNFLQDDQIELQRFDRSDGSPPTSIRLTEEENRKFLNEYWSSQMNNAQGISFYQKHANSLAVDEHLTKGKKHQPSPDSSKAVVNGITRKKSSKNDQRHSKHAEKVHSYTIISEDAPKFLFNQNGSQNNASFQKAALSAKQPSVKLLDSGIHIARPSNSPCFCSKQMTNEKFEMPSNDKIFLQSKRQKRNKEALSHEPMCTCMFNETQVPNDASGPICGANNSSIEQKRKKSKSPARQPHLFMAVPFNEKNQTSNEDTAECLSFSEISNFVGERDMCLQDSHVRMSLRESCRITQNEEETTPSSSFCSNNKSALSSILSPVFSESVADSNTITSPPSAKNISKFVYSSDDEEIDEYLCIPGTSNDSRSTITDTTPSTHLAFRNCELSIPCDVYCNDSSSTKSNTLEFIPPLQSDLTVASENANRNFSMPCDSHCYSSTFTKSKASEHRPLLQAGTVNTANASFVDCANESHQHPPPPLSAFRSASDVAARTVDEPERLLGISSPSENVQRTMHNTNAVTLSPSSSASVSQSNVLLPGPRMPAESYSHSQHQNRPQLGHEQHRPLFSVLL